MKKVSIIVPCYNQAKYLSEALESLAQQTYDDWECIIINDGSKDNTREIAQKWVDKDERFKYIETANGGVSKARNIGIKKAIGEYILPLDADDKIHNTYIEKALNIIQNNPELKLVYCEAAMFGVANRKWNLPKYSYKKLLVKNMIFTSALYRKKEYELVGGYTEGILFEDWNFWLKLLNKDNQVYRIPEELFFYRKHENSLMDNLAKKGELYYKSINTIFKSNTNSFLNEIGNPMDLEQERRELSQEINSNNYKFYKKISKTILYKLLYKYFG
ncbi:MAG: glycosyltransferase [Flavobacteriaceae bacterium]|nr:glycosyltransferase [Flavobacteriaceae bacterium]